MALLGAVWWSSQPPKNPLMPKTKKPAGRHLSWKISRLTRIVQAIIRTKQKKKKRTKVFFFL